MDFSLLLMIGGVFITVALLAGSTASWWLVHNSPEQRRLRSLAIPAPAVIVTKTLSADETDPVLARLSRLLPKSPSEMSRLQRRLRRAGLASNAAPIYFSIAQLTLPLLIAGPILLYLGVSEGWMYAAGGAAVGYIVPGFFVDYKTAQRKKLITNGLADALDLITVCVEAGSGLDQAIIKASEELAIAHPEVAAELKLVTTETRAGKPRTEAFKNFSTRTGVDDVRSLVAMLIQTDRFGTSIGQALRTHAETIRTKRRQRAEERAAKVGVKLVFPLALCLFPALYVVCFGPVVVRIYRSILEGG
jgi:tight adherence protein C